MDWKQKLQSARQAGEQMLDQKTEKAIEENWPKIQQVFEEKVGPAALAAAQDDQKMESLFKLVYIALPLPVHLVIKEDAFVKYCFSHRDRLLSGQGAGGSVE
jgi:hypothetical protein